MFCDVFSSREVEVSLISFEIKLIKLHQRLNELLFIYYKRICNFIKGVSAKNKLISMSAAVFSLFESTMLDIILRSFIRNIDDHEIRKKVIKDMIIIDRFFRFVYNLVEEARRINVKIQKFAKEKSKSNELLFYKSLMKKNLSKQQMTSLLTSHQISKTSRDQTP